MRESEPLYVISVAARLLDLHPQTLRKYERVGFVIPSRTNGNLRLYSAEDIERLEQVKRLKDERGVNLAGVEMALEVSRKIRAMQRELRSAKRRDYDSVADALDDV
ncbi:MAG: heat shock protein transcriptional repressor HspR, partial [Chloroflexota bacterium]